MATLSDQLCFASLSNGGIAVSRMTPGPGIVTGRVNRNGRLASTPLTCDVVVEGSLPYAASAWRGQPALGVV